MLGVVQHPSDLSDMKQFNLLPLHHFVLTTVVLVERNECPLRRELMQHSPCSIQLLIRLQDIPQSRDHYHKRRNNNP